MSPPAPAPAAPGDPRGPGSATRRRALGVGLTSATALALSACGAHKNHIVSTATVASQDVTLLSGLLQLEYKTIAAYEAGIPLLDPTTAKGPEQYLRHELSHAGELVGLIKKATGQIPKPLGGYDLGKPRNARQILELFRSLESEQITAYLHAIPLLSDGHVQAALGAVLANDAQHLALLRGQLHLPPAPTAFPTGRE